MAVPSTTTRRDSGADGDRRENDRATTISLDGGRQLAYAEYGQPSGAPVLFLHGTPGSRRLGALFDEAARERDVRILAPDRPGYGRSTTWSERPIRDADRYVRAVLDDANVQRAGVVAFSGGAPHALATAARCPDIVGRIDLVAGATPPDVTAEQPVTQRALNGLATRAPTLLDGLFRGQAWLARRLDPSFVIAQYTASDVDEPLPDEVATTIKADFLTALAGDGSGTVAELRATATDWEIDFESVEADVRFWHGTNDTNVPIEGVRAFAQRLPTASLQTLDGADHLRTLLRSVPEIVEEHR